MKAELKKHISEIFSTLQITVPFEVYECENDAMPKWTNQVSLTHDFLICCEQLSDREKLQKLTCKEIYQHENVIYWFEGERIVEDEQSIRESIIDLMETEIDYLKAETRLPQWLDNFIFDHLKAEYAPDFQRFEYNLDLNKDENLKYLGTYFPRSYAESFCMFDNIFQNEQYQKIISQKKCLNILSIGCGTGGDLIGLITTIEKYCPKISEISIWGLDGNEGALSILEKVIEEFRIVHSKNIKLKTIETVFDSVAKIDVEQIGEQTFDFILSFKMICEIISAGNGARDDSYYDFVMKFAPLLSENGLCVLLDVTTKAEHSNTHNPILKNRQVNRALRELKNYQTLLPLSCNKSEKICTERCFTQRKFYVSHKGKKGKKSDESKVSYRVIAKAEFVKTLVNSSGIAKYVLQKNEQNIERLCPYSYGEKIIDGYKLNK